MRICWLLIISKSKNLSLIVHLYGLPERAGIFYAFSGLLSPNAICQWEQVRGILKSSNISLQIEKNELCRKTGGTSMFISERASRKASSSLYLEKRIAFSPWVIQVLWTVCHDMSVPADETTHSAAWKYAAEMGAGNGLGKGAFILKTNNDKSGGTEPEGILQQE